MRASTPRAQAHRAARSCVTATFTAARVAERRPVARCGAESRPETPGVAERGTEGAAGTSAGSRSGSSLAASSTGPSCQYGHTAVA